MVADAVTGSGLWTVRPEPQRTDKPSIAKSVKTSVSGTLFDEKRRRVLALLGFDPDTPTVVGGALVSTTEVFQRLLTLSDEETLDVLAVVMGESLQAGTELIEALGVHLEVDMSAAWKADDALFDLIRDRAVLTRMVAEVAGEEVAAANASEKGKALKAIIRDCLAGQSGRMRVKGWVPAWLRFPAGRYMKPEGTQ